MQKMSQRRKKEQGQSVVLIIGEVIKSLHEFGARVEKVVKRGILREENCYAGTKVLIGIRRGRPGN